MSKDNCPRTVRLKQTKLSLLIYNRIRNLLDQRSLRKKTPTQITLNLLQPIKH